MMSYLKQKLESHKMYIVSILIDKFVLKVQSRKEKGKNIHMDMEMYYGDSLSAVLFIVYLAKSNKPLTKLIKKSSKEND